MLLQKEWEEKDGQVTYSEEEWTYLVTAETWVVKVKEANRCSETANPDGWKKGMSTLQMRQIFRG